LLCSFFKPTIFTDISESSRINKEEVFGMLPCYPSNIKLTLHIGPVVVLHKFSDEDDVIAKANDSESAILLLS